MIKKIRLDILLCKKKLSVSRDKARALILSGCVIVNNVKCDKPGVKFSENVKIVLKGFVAKYVGRGGYKLAAALKENMLNSENKICLDVGVSIGGFTDCLLKNGASKIFAIDVGYGQVSWKIRQNSKVVLLERTNVKHINKTLIYDNIDIIVIDVSFISLKVVVPLIIPFLNKKGIIIALIKPQFEIGKGKIKKKGVIKSSIIHENVLRKLLLFFKKKKLVCKSLIQSPLRGNKGNSEFLVLLTK